MELRHRLIIDCDPGHDDAVALMLAFASPEFDILGITTTTGNVSVELTQKNARMLCEFAGRSDIAVYAGSERPLRRFSHYASVHGKSGLDGFPSFEPSLPAEQKPAVDFIIDTLLADEDGAITIACLGPLTNLAAVLLKAPEVGAKIRQIVLMGGARSTGGNVTPAATFNIHFDPEAAQVVFSSGRPVVAISLDACSRVLCGRKWLDVLRGSGRRIAMTMADLIAHYDAVRARKFGFTTDGASVNDPCVIAYLLDPTLFQARHVNVEIEVQSALTLGMTVVDFWGVTDRRPNATWVYEADGDRVLDVLTSRINRL